MEAVVKEEKVSDGYDSDKSDGTSEKCPICLLPFRKQEVATPSSCEHCFCLECIVEWSKNINTCPVDRTSFTVINVRNKFAGQVRVRSTQTHFIQSTQNSTSNSNFLIYRFRLWDIYRSKWNHQSKIRSLKIQHFVKFVTSLTEKTGCFYATVATRVTIWNVSLLLLVKFLSKNGSVPTVRKIANLTLKL